MRTRTLEAAGVGALALLLSVVMTWPLAAGLGSLGRTNSGDGLFSIWCVAWVARALSSNPLGLFDANVFYPHTATLAYSEANFIPGLLAIPAWLATGNAYFAHNVVVLLAFALSFTGAYLLARYLTGSRVAALSAGVAFAYCPFVFARTAHIQLLMTAGIPWSLWALHRFVDEVTWRRAVVLGLVLTLQALSCGYYGIFVAMLVGVGTLWFGAWRGLWRSARYWRLVALAAAVSIGLVAPFFAPFVQVQRELGFARSIDDAAMYSADWQAWLASAAWAHRWWLPALGAWNEVLFPGVLTLVGGITGIHWASRRADRSQAHAHVAWFYGLVGVIAGWASFGPTLGLYTAMFHVIPVFSLLRAPARFGILVVLALVVGLAYAVARLSRIATGRWRYAIWAVPVLLVGELATLPLGWRHVPPPNPAYRMLRTLPHGVVAEFPFFYRRTDFPRHTEYMVNSTLHWKPLVNGYSDHIPQDFRDAVIELSTFPAQSAFRQLQARQTRYVVIHLNGYDRRSREKLMDRLVQYQRYLYPLSRENDVWLFEIIDWPR